MASHLRFIQEDVFTAIEKRFRTDPHNRAYIGNSFGGLFGAFILLAAPNTFKNYILGSPSLWWDTVFMLKSISKNALFPR